MQMRYSVSAAHSDPIFEDVDGDGRPELLLHDWTFAYWKTSFAGSPAPKVILRFDKDSVTLAADLMRKPAVPWLELVGKASAVLRNPYWDNFKVNPDGTTGNPDGMSGNPPPQLWAMMLDLIYSGQWRQAFEFLDLSWPRGLPGKSEFEHEFLAELQTSPYWTPVIDALYDGRVPRR